MEELKPADQIYCRIPDDMPCALGYYGSGGGVVDGDLVFHTAPHMLGYAVIREEAERIATGVRALRQLMQTSDWMRMAQAQDWNGMNQAANLVLDQLHSPLEQPFGRQLELPI